VLDALGEGSVGRSRRAAVLGVLAAAVLAGGGTLALHPQAARARVQRVERLISTPTTPQPVRTVRQAAPDTGSRSGGRSTATAPFHTVPQTPASPTARPRDAAPSAPPVPRPHYPVQVIGHRGAPAYRPQHTLAGYQVAIDQGADFIEPDLVITRDGVLIARHSRDLTGTTDVAAHPELADLARDGHWYAEDLTVAQIRTLHATGGPAGWSGVPPVPTLDEIVDLLHRQDRKVGLYVELKDPAYLRGIGLPMEEKLAAVLDANGWTSADAPVWVESFEVDSLRRMHGLTTVRLTQLVWGDGSTDQVTGEQLTSIAEYADAVGVDRARLTGPLASPVPAGTGLVAEAKARHLAVHVFTLNGHSPDNSFLATHGNPEDPPVWASATAYYRAMYALGVQAVFTDTPDIAVYARG